MENSNKQESSNREEIQTTEKASCVPPSVHKDDLLCCPFCGGDAIIEQTRSNELQVKCGHCLIGLKQKVKHNSLKWLRGVLIKAWNQRAR